jgi:Uma2 family endonuclease
MALPKDGYKRELLNGEIVMSPAGSEHGRKISRFMFALMKHVYEHRLGEVFEGQSGYRMKSRDVLSADVSFIAKKHLKGSSG